MKNRLGLYILMLLIGANVAYWGPRAWALRSSVFDQIDLLVDIRHEIVSGYVTEPDQNKMVQSAVRAMVESLSDPYTIYLAPEDLGNFDKAIRGTFSGIGAEVGIEQNRLKIITPLEDSPAWKAGIMAGDIVLDIDGTSTLGLKINECIEKLQGPEGTPVKLKVRHETGEEAELTITRQRINVQTVRGARRGADGHWDFMLDPVNKIGYVRVSQFTEPTEGELRAAIKTLKDQNAKALIMDLRFDPGGLLESAVAISDMFLEKGKRIVSVKGRAVSERVEYATEKDEVPASMPIVIIANEASASASEVVTGALTDNNRALMVGTRTFGKGSVQQVIGLENNQGAIKMTNAYYYLPNGRNIHRREGSETWGVDPSEGCYVPMSPEQIRKMAEIRRQGDILRGPATQPTSAGTVVTPESIAKDLADPQLAAALKASIGKLTTNQWPQVGLSNAQQIARQTRHENLVRQRDQMKQRLDEIEVEIDKLDGAMALAATQPGTPARGELITTQPATQPATK